jgi:hypothetical protein
LALVECDRWGRRGENGGGSFKMGERAGGRKRRCEAG